MVSLESHDSDLLRAQDIIGDTILHFLPALRRPSFPAVRGLLEALWPSFESQLHSI